MIFVKILPHADETKAYSLHTVHVMIQLAYDVTGLAHKSGSFFWPIWLESTMNQIIC